MSPLSRNKPKKKKKTNQSRDKWDIIEILARPMSAVATAAAIAAIGYFGQKTLTQINAQEQRTLTELAAQEQNARLYTQLLSRREESESALRKDMFKAVLEKFFEKRNDDPDNIDLSKKLLKLEMLALNFGDSLSLGPLFSETARDIEIVAEANKEHDSNWKITASKYQKRLRSLARRVASVQLASINPKGKSIEFSVPVHRVEILPGGPSEEWQYTWPNDALGETRAQRGADQADYQETGLGYGERELNGVRRGFTIQFRNADLERRRVQVEVRISDLDPEKVQATDTNMVFTLDYFNFPLIDNTRLSHNHRFALILEKFDQESIDVKGVLFPGLYASQRDKPFLNEAIQQLKDQQKSFSGESTESQNGGINDSEQKEGV
jgi:hypothetical protein